LHLGSLTWVFHRFPILTCLVLNPKHAFLFFIILYSFIHMCIHCLGHFSPLPPAPLFSPPHPLTSRQSLFCPYL
jgi:hypothetical protein